MQKHRFVFLSGALLCLLSCNGPSDSDNDLIYMWFDVEGSVVNEADEPIEGISVYAESADPVLTGTDGGFSIRGGSLPAETTVLRFIDNDITDNVSYISKSVTVDLVKYKDGQGWTEGYYKNRDKLVVVMTEAAEITPSDPDVEASPEARQ